MTPASAVGSREDARATHLHEELLLQAAHDLRSPLGALRLWIDIHGTEHGTPSPSLARIDRSAEELARIIDDMVDASRLLGGRAHLDRTSSSLSDLVRRCAVVLSKGGVVVTLGAIDELPGAWVDGPRLERALMLLVRSLAKGDATGVELSLVVGGGWAEVHVIRGAGPAKAPSEVSVALATAVVELHDGELGTAERSGRSVWTLRVPLGAGPQVSRREKA